MSNPVYDIITVGGGLGGSAIAKAMAEHGARVLVLEREKQFHDRVRATEGRAEVTLTFAENPDARSIMKPRHPRCECVALREVHSLGMNKLARLVLRALLCRCSP